MALVNEATLMPVRNPFRRAVKYEPTYGATIDGVNYSVEALAIKQMADAAQRLRDAGVDLSKMPSFTVEDVDRINRQR